MLSPDLDYNVVVGFTSIYRYEKNCGRHSLTFILHNTTTMAGTNKNGNGNDAPKIKVGTDTVKQGLAQMLKGGVIVSFRWLVSWNCRAETF